IAAGDAAGVAAAALDLCAGMDAVQATGAADALAAGVAEGQLAAARALRIDLCARLRAAAALAAAAP
ncbi:hypothetical protein, partial [Oceanicella actignis]